MGNGDFVPHFDISLSPNFGYVFHLEALAKEIEDYETATTSSSYLYTEENGPCFR